MPFKKLKLRKTRHYNVLSRNVLVLSIELIDKTPIECTLSADSSGLDCLHNVCQRLGLQQSDFFGLRYMSKRPYPKVRWVELDRPLKKQLQKYAQSPALALAVQYYIHDVGLLQDDMTRTQYFLQVKQDVIEGKLRCNYEQAVLLASYSLQAEFGDHQPERHTPEYLKDFKLFPKQAVSEGDVGSLLDAVVWQYSSLTGLATALAETYYILEAQGLPGYGHETFIARDEKGSEVYLGASLLGIVVQPASGESQTFYRWNAITNLINHRRTFGIECACSEQTVNFSFEEPDAAKYVWKMCVKQHTFYEGNQDLLDGSTNTGDTRSLAIPDIQSSVLTPSFKGLHLNAQQNTELTPQNGHITSNLESPQLNTTDSFNFLSQSGYSLGDANFSIKQMQQRPTQLQQQSQYVQPRSTPQQLHSTTLPLPHQQQQQSQQDSSNVGLFTANLNATTGRNSIRRALLPQYRLTPDYETALLHKYGPGMSSQMRTMLYSSQPEISSPNKTDLIDAKKNGNLSNYNHNYGDSPLIRGAQVPKTPGILFTGTLHNTYSTPELAHLSYPDDSMDQKLETSHLEYHLVHGYKPPPPYPYSKPSSNSTPDLASSCKEENCHPDIAARKKSLLTASLGCLGSPELSRTYENLTDLNDVVESLRKELTKSSSEKGTSFLHSFSPNLSRDDLDVIYQLQNGHVAVGQNLKFGESGGGINLSKQKSSYKTVNPGKEDEPIYQNVTSLLTTIPEDMQDRTKSTPHLESSLGNAKLVNQSGTTGFDDGARNRSITHPTGPYDNLKTQQTKPLAYEAVNPLTDSYEQIAQYLQQQKQQLHLKQQQHNLRYNAQQVQHHQFVGDKQRTTVEPSPQSLNNHSIQHMGSPKHPQQPMMGVSTVPLQLNEPISKKQTQSTPDKALKGNNVPSLGDPSMNNGHLKDSIKPSSPPSYQSHISNKEKFSIRPHFVPEYRPPHDSRINYFKEKVENTDLITEFQSIPMVKPNAEFALASKPEPLVANANREVIPYEENRVKITPSKDNKSGYINASHITASIGDSQRFYICTQDPISSTVLHFWQCIWETDVRLIVMLTSVIGVSTKSKSFPYWPQTDNTSVECNQFRIYRKHSTRSSFHTTCRLQLVNVAQRKSRSVWHLQFNDWADHAQDAQSFLSFLQEISTLRRVTFNEVEGVCKNRNTPVLVHCASGGGLSGVTILCDLILQAIDNNLAVEFAKVLLHLRQQRMSIVNSLNLYKFAHRVIIAYLQKTRLI